MTWELHVDLGLLLNTEWWQESDSPRAVTGPRTAWDKRLCVIVVTPKWLFIFSNATDCLERNIGKDLEWKRATTPQSIWKLSRLYHPSLLAPWGILSQLYAGSYTNQVWSLGYPCVAGYHALRVWGISFSSRSPGICCMEGNISMSITLKN